MQFLWKYIDDLIGKGLDAFQVSQLIMYSIARFIPLALPIAVLISSVMVIGKLGEDYELAALQSSGISLLKIMKPIFLIVIVISSFSYIFSNYIMPIANFKGGSLLYDIKKKKPALNIKEGIFYNDIDGYSIKIETKSDNGNTLNNILIYDHTNNSGNKKVIIAESGNMNITNDERYMELNLFNGISYIEIEEIKKSKKNPHRKISFDKELIRFDLASFNIKNSELLYKGHYAMLNNQQLLNSIDSLKNKVIIKEKLIYSRLEKNYHYKQDVNQNFNNDIIKINKNRIYETAINKLRVLRSVCKSNSDDLEYKKKIISKHKIEWHRKISIAFSCIIMFLIGAPLGAIVRKGGFSIPLLMSIILFVIFYVTSIIGEKSAKDLIISPIAGMWMANIIFFPISIYLIMQALRNSSLPKIKDLIKLKA
jgi:lipopolysaccharide export system permease protein|tara:strand:- start:3318 stop:4589 length:1272 start_codon:yes stop_codon:yes gene_type:complete